MITLSASLVLRPTRIGFLVEPHDSASLRRIFQTCACLWGGVFNPIIPVCDTLPEAWKDFHPALDPSPEDLARGYLDFFEPDVFVEAQRGLAAKAGIGASDLDFDRPRIVALDSFFGTDHEGDGDVPFGTNVFHIYKNLYEREFKFVPRDDRRVAFMESGSVDAAFVEASFGGFPLDGPHQVLAQAYVDAFAPLKLAPTSENWIKVIKEGFRMPLHFTREGIKHGPGGWSQPTLFVVDSSSSLDLVDLWNIRQFHPQILAVNLSWLHETKDYLSEFLRVNHRPLPGNPNGVMIHPIIQFGRSISEERAKTAVEEAGFTNLTGTPWARKSWYDPIWTVDRDDYPVRPRRAGIVAASTDLDLAVSGDDNDLRCHFVSLSPDFVDKYGVTPARWVNVLKFYNYGVHGMNDALALTLPSSFTGEYSRRLRVAGSTIVSREGFVLPQKYKQQREYFRILTGQEAVICWLKSQGVNAEPSDPGRIADQILASLQGFQGVRLIADRDTINLLDEMSKSVRKHVDGTLEEFSNRSISVKRWKKLVHQRSNGRLGRGLTLDGFIKANVLRLGLVLECMNCRKKNWFGIESLREQLTCERCLKAYAFPQGSSEFFAGTPWQYRIVGPYSVPNFAEGAYATVLAIRAFAIGLDRNPNNMTYATGLHFKIGAANSFEVDFTLWYQRRRLLDVEEEPVLVFGEAKSFAVESFKLDDLARMRKLGEQFPGAFLVFATLKDNLSDAEKTEIGQLAIWGRESLPDGRPRAPVIVLTGIELFYALDIKDSWHEVGGQREKFSMQPGVQLDNLWTLADMTQQIYLGLSDPHARGLMPVPAT